MPKLVKIHNDTYDTLSTVRREGETFDEAIVRLLTLYSVLKRVLAESSLEVK